MLTLDEIAGLEWSWRDRRDPPEGSWGFVPYPLPIFDRILRAAIAAAPAPTFLEVGCGIGTKCLLAASYGLAAAGVEIDPVLAAKARELGVTVHEQDVREFGGYGDYGIVYVNRPLREVEAEDALERKIREEMAPGAVLIVTNSWAHPLAWIPVCDERAAWRGVWQKPPGAAAGEPRTAARRPDDGAMAVSRDGPTLEQLIDAGLISRTFA